MFETIEDETGIANVIVWPKVFEKYRTIVLASRFVGIRGRLQSEDGVIHLVAEHLEDLTHLLVDIAGEAEQMGGLANADEVKNPSQDIRQKIKPATRLPKVLKASPTRHAATQTTRALPGGRNFH